MVGLVLRSIEFTTSDMISLYFVGRMYPVLISQLGSCPAVHLPSRSWGLQKMVIFLQDRWMWTCKTISPFLAYQSFKSFKRSVVRHCQPTFHRDFRTWIPYFKGWNNMMTFASLKRKKHKGGEIPYESNRIPGNIPSMGELHWTTRTWWLISSKIRASRVRGFHCSELVSNHRLKPLGGIRSLAWWD